MKILKIFDCTLTIEYDGLPYHYPITQLEKSALNFVRSKDTFSSLCYLIVKLDFISKQSTDFRFV